MLCIFYALFLLSWWGRKERVDDPAYPKPVRYFGVAKLFF